MATARAISPGKRSKIIELRNLKWSYSSIANEVGVTKSACYKVWQKFEATSSIEDRPRRGRPRKTEEQRLLDAERKRAEASITNDLSAFHNIRVSSKPFQESASPNSSELDSPALGKILFLDDSDGKLYLLNKPRESS